MSELSLYDRIKEKMKYKNNFDYWYNYGRTANIEEFWYAFQLSKYENCRIMKYLFLGALRENKLQICEECLEEQEFLSIIDIQVFTYATTNKARSFIINFFQNIKSSNYYRNNNIVGKCRCKSFKKIKKNIDKISNRHIMEKCLLASIENEDKNIFEYIYQKYLKMPYDLNIESSCQEELEFIFLDALDKGKYLLIDHLINKIPKEFFEHTLTHKQISKIREYINNKIDRMDQIISTKKSADNMSCVPKDIYNHIIKKFLYPKI